MPFQSYGMSLAVRDDHAVLPSTQHKWTCPALYGIPSQKGWYLI